MSEGVASKPPHGISTDAIAKIRGEVPDLCTWVWSARTINTRVGVEDCYANTISTMKVIVEMLASEPIGNLLPSASERRGWNPATMARIDQVMGVSDDVKEVQKVVADTVQRLEKAAEDLEKVKALVIHKHKTALQDLCDLATSAANGTFDAGADYSRLMFQIKKEVREQMEREAVARHPEPEDARGSKRRDSVSQGSEGASGASDNSITSCEDERDIWGGFADESESTPDSPPTPTRPRRRGRPRDDSAITFMEVSDPETVEASFQDFFRANNEPLFRELNAEWNTIAPPPAPPPSPIEPTPNPIDS